jgi:hypothetical protein
MAFVQTTHVPASVVSMGTVFVVCGWISQVCLIRMAGAVNAVLPENERFGRWWWTFGKMWRVYKAHRSIYPLDGIRAWFVVTYALALLLMILTFVMAAHSLHHP